MRLRSANQTSYDEQDEENDADDLAADLEVFAGLHDHLEKERDQVEEEGDDEERLDGVVFVFGVAVVIVTLATIVVVIVTLVTIVVVIVTLATIVLVIVALATIVVVIVALATIVVVIVTLVTIVVVIVALATIVVVIVTLVTIVLVIVALVTAIVVLVVVLVIIVIIIAADAAAADGDGHRVDVDSPRREHQSSFAVIHRGRVACLRCLRIRRKVIHGFL